MNEYISVFGFASPIFFFILTNVLRLKEKKTFNVSSKLELELLFFFNLKKQRRVLHFMPPFF